MNPKKPSAVFWIWNNIRGYRRFIGALLVMQSVSGSIGVVNALILRSLVDSAVEKKSSAVLFFAVVMVGVMVLQIALRFFERWCQEYTRASIENRVKSALFSDLLHKDYAMVTKIHSGEWMNRLTSDTAVVADGASAILPGFAGMAVRLTGALAMLIILIPKLLWVIPPACVFLLVFTYLFRKPLKRLHKRIQESDGFLRVFLSEQISSLMIVHSYAKEDAALSEAESRMSAHHKARMRRTMIAAACNIVFMFLMLGAYVGGAIFCAYGILHGGITYGTFSAVLALIVQTQQPFSGITGYLPRYYAMTASAERLMEAGGYRDDISGVRRSGEEAKKFYQTHMVGLSFCDASFSYDSADGKRPVLCHFDLSVRRGEYIAFCGPSGCGKSTVLKLLLSLYPLNGGSCSIDTAEGEQIPLSSEWRSLFAYVPQGNHLMCGTIRDVIAFGDPVLAKDDERLWTALRAACAESFVKELEKGLDTMLGEHGSGLSEGQMQRIAIARALCADRPILLLDEATSALDEKTETALLTSLRSMTDKTVLIVTHRPAALDVCDRTVYMEAIQTEEERGTAK
ncbi:MAG: ABC transporter ATP-binding protein/permease [Clostridia bacterium]|nr:ABC transporter ATP-binding protein/permease [Clostridia bacterium]